jgi:purine nucleosidase
VALSELAGWTTPIFVGASGPWKNKQARLPFPTEIHGEYGLGPFRLQPTGAVQVQPMSASEFMSAAVRAFPNQVTILTLGPLTDVAKTMEADPEFAGLVLELVALCGAFGVRGNVTEACEFNAYADRAAAKFVLESCIPKRVVGLDVTTNQVLFADEFSKLSACNPFGLGKIIEASLEYYAAFHYRTEHYFGCLLHDLVAVFALMYPQMFWFFTCNITVDVKSGDTNFAEGACSQVATAMRSVDFWVQFWRTFCAPCLA